jgi:hypothetical protein
MSSAPSAKKTQRNRATYDAADPRIERLIVLVLCVLAATRVFLFSAGFPFFNNVDEQAHFDLVHKYSVGHVPTQKVENFSRESAELIVLYGSPEYFAPPASGGPATIPPPAWTIPEVRSSRPFERAVADWLEQPNHESTSFPSYYTVTGLWTAIGRGMGLDGGQLLYWIRFLNVPLHAALVFVAYLIGRMLARGNPVQRLGLPLLIAFFPQDVFYSINSDAISPLLFAVSFLMLLQVYFENRSIRHHALTGLAVAGCFLVKPTNLAVLVLAGMVVLLRAKKLLDEARFREQRTGLVALSCAALIPVAAWLGRNLYLFGDITGSAHKAEQLGWTLKPLGQLWDHPLVGIDGWFFFLKGITMSFWRGELVWQLEAIRSRRLDEFFIYSSAAFLLISLVALLRNRTGGGSSYRLAVGMSFATLAISVMILAALSMVFDFGDCWAPSRESPYFLAGRLILCCLLPFLIVYIDGLGRLIPRSKHPALPLAVILCMAIGITVAELVMSWSVFSSQYNWFHLGG